MKLRSSELKSFFNGIILGDGHIHSGITKRALEIKSINKDFIEFLSNTISENTNLKYVIKEFDESFKKDVHRKKYWSLYIKSHPIFAKKYHHFYDDYKNRKISNEVIRDITPITLAIWYMSDGYVCLVGKTKGDITCRRVDICTDRYKLDDIKRLVLGLKDKLDLDFSIIKRKNLYRIRLKSNSYSRFFEMVYPYIVPSMKYKCYLGYSYQPKYISDWLYSIQEECRSALENRFFE